MELYRPGAIPEPPRPPKRRRVKVSQRIYTFDIEVTSIFHHEDGWGLFRPEYDAEYYKTHASAAVPYIWMLGIEQDDGSVRTIFGRRFGGNLLRLFLDLGDPDTKKIVWIHNLPYEFQNCLLDILPMPIDKLVSRKARKPVRFYVPDWNIEFRCSYALTGLSLKTAAATYGRHKKQSGDKFNYNLLRTPLTHLTRREFKYCEADVVTLVEIIQWYRKEYQKLQWIPLTATGEIRKELRRRVSFDYIRQVRKLAPKDAGRFLLLMRAFQGGYTHSCYLRTGKVLRSGSEDLAGLDLISEDKASAYPADMLSYRFPMSHFFKTTYEKSLTLDRDRWAILYHVKLHGVRSLLINNYILTSKAVRADNFRNDSGRLISADMIEMVLTEVDFDIIRRCYEIDEVEPVQVLACRKGWLPKPLLEYVMDLYGQKTSLKGVAGEEELYRKSKTRINGLFGCCCTNVIKGSSEYSDEDPRRPEAGPHWWTHELTVDFVNEELDKLKKSRSNCFAYPWGVWITAYCRATTWALLEALDPVKVGLKKAAIYSDTDSVKAPDSRELRAAVQKLNEERVARLRLMCEENDIDPERLAPADPKGVRHMIGLFECDGKYAEFITLGPKRYAHRDKDGILRITVSGVNSEKGRKRLCNQIDTFKDGIIFNYGQCGKMISAYNDHQEPLDVVDREGNVWHETARHALALYPTTYRMGVDEVYAALWEQIFEEAKYEDNLERGEGQTCTEHYSE